MKKRRYCLYHWACIVGVRCEPQFVKRKQNIPWTNESDRQTDRQTGNVLSVSLLTFYKIWSDKYDYVQRLFDLEFVFRKNVFKVTAHPLPRATYGLSLFQTRIFTDLFDLDLLTRLKTMKAFQSWFLVCSEYRLVFCSHGWSDEHF